MLPRCERVALPSESGCDVTQDWIRETLAARAADLDLTAYAVGKATGIDVGTVRRYFAGRCALNSRYVSALATHLGMTLEVAKQDGTPPELGDAICPD